MFIVPSLEGVPVDPRVEVSSQGDLRKKRTVVIYGKRGRGTVCCQFERRSLRPFTARAVVGGWEAPLPVRPHPR